MSRLSLKAVKSFLGSVLIITDNVTNKSIEVMDVQLNRILKSDSNTGQLPHAGWMKNGNEITIYHDEDQENHEVTFTMEELKECIKN